MQLKIRSAGAGTGGAEEEDACDQPGEVEAAAQGSEAFLEAEARRRAFWMALCIGRCFCVLDEQDR